MLETILIEKPSKKQIERFTRRYMHNGALSPEWRSGIPLHQKVIDFVLPPEESKSHRFYRQMTEQSMTKGGKLLLIGKKREEFLKRFYPLGFVSYIIGNQSFLDASWNSVQYSEEVRDKRWKNRELYTTAFVQDYLAILLGGSADDPIISSDNLKNIFPYTRYSGVGPIVFIQGIEADLSQGKKGLETRLIKEIEKTEHPEIIEGLADPASLVFWDKMGFSILPLYQKHLTAIAWKNPEY